MIYREKYNKVMNNDVLCLRNAIVARTHIRNYRSDLQSDLLYETYRN